MEASVENIFEAQREVTTSRTRSKIGKPPTRLQQQAPASLLLDQIKSNTGNNNNKNNNPFGRSRESSPSHTPIPLLSPLIVSPPAEEFRFPCLSANGDLSRGNEDISNSRVASMGPGGWQHPAVVGAYMEPSSLFAFFQSKCMLVPHGQ